MNDDKLTEIAEFIIDDTLADDQPSMTLPGVVRRLRNMVDDATAELRAQLEAMTDIAKRNQERAAWLEAHEEGWRTQHLEDTKRNEALAAFVADFCDVAEMAATQHDGGGMRVSYHGDFASAVPSVRRDLAAWAKRGREVLAAKGAEHE